MLPLGDILLYVVSQFEEKFEEVSGVVTPPKLHSGKSMANPETVGNPTLAVATEDSKEKELQVNNQDSQRGFPDVNSSQDFGSGMMKIVPSDVDVSSIFEYADTDIINNLCLLVTTSKDHLSQFPLKSLSTYATHLCGLNHRNCIVPFIKDPLYVTGTNNLNRQRLLFLICLFLGFQLFEHLICH